MSKSSKKHTDRNFDGIWEILLSVAIVPAVIYGVMSLNNLPIA